MNNSLQDGNAKMPLNHTGTTLSGPALVKPTVGAGNVELREATVGPALPGQVLLRVAATGICGTDLHILDGEWPVVPPVIVGHEVSGTVEAVGEGVDPGWIGSRVVSEVFFGSCGLCDSCRSGHRNLCANRKSLGSHVNGAFGPGVLVPASIIHAIPASIDLVEAALIEPLACVVGAFADPALIAPSDRVLVTGPGAIGQFAAQVARAAGAEVVLAGLSSDVERLRIAGELGFMTLALDEEDPESLRERFDVVVECSGSKGGIEVCLTAIKRRGRYVQLGLAGRPVEVSIDALCLKELTMSSGFGATPSGIRRAIQLVADGRVQLGPLVTGVVPIDRWEEAFTRTRAGDGVKFLIVPPATQAGSSSTL